MCTLERESHSLGGNATKDALHLPDFFSYTVLPIRRALTQTNDTRSELSHPVLTPAKFRARKLLLLLILGEPGLMPCHALCFHEVQKYHSVTLTGSD